MRNIDASIFMDDFIGSQSLRLRLLWIGLILSIADDQGRMLDKPLTIKAAIFPFDVKIAVSDIEADLKLLAKNKKILRYTSKDGRALIQIINWWRYQATAQWAGRSILPAPPKWTDRIRAHEAGHGQTPVTEHWNETGGFSSKPLPSRYIAPTQPQARREDNDEDNDNEEEEENQSKDHPTTPTPPSAKEQAGKVRKVQSKKQENPDWDKELEKLTKKQRPAAELTRKIFSSFGLRDPKLMTLSVLVATRSYNGTLRKMLLGAIASAHDDETAKNKAIVAAHRLETNQIPAEYLSPKKWTSLPDDVLKAAGVGDLDKYKDNNRQRSIEEKIKRFAS